MTLTQTHTTLLSLGAALALLFSSGCDDTGTGAADTSTTDSGDGATCRPVPTATADGCPTGWFHNDQDYCCSAPPPADVTTCPDYGDGLCHFECATDADCGPCRPHCRTVGLCAGGDSNCNDTFRACTAEAGADECS